MKALNRQRPRADVFRMVDDLTTQGRATLRHKGSVLRTAFYFVFLVVFLLRGLLLGRVSSYLVAGLFLGFGLWFVRRFRKLHRGSIVGPMVIDMVMIFLAAWEAHLAPYSAIPYVVALLVAAFTLAPDREAKGLLVPAGLIWLALSVRRIVDLGVTDTTLVETGISLVGMLALFRYLPVVAASTTAVIEAKDRQVAESSQAADMQHRFTSMVSHELRSPLTAITGFAELMMDPDAGLTDEDRAEFLGMIHSQSVEMDRLLEDILIALRLDAGKLTFDMTVVPVAKKIREIVAGFSNTAGRTITVDANAGVNAFGDSLRFGQIMRNLIGNACKHGGPNIRVSSDQLDGQIVVKVEDDGPGVDPEVLEKLFGDYVQGRGESRNLGFGLGLGIARRLAEGMGGSLRYVESEKGACFCVSIPAA